MNDSPTRFCTSCSSVLTDGARFCASCGAAVPTPSPARASGVDALAAGMPPGSVRRSGGGNASCLGCLAVIVAGLAVLVAVFTGLLRMSGAYEQALDIARADPRIQEALGEPITASWFTVGSVASGAGRWRVNATVYLSGPNGKGTLRLRATTLRGYTDRRWDQFSVFEYYRDGEPYEIPIRASAGASTPR
jgi:hypothetical protein